MLNKGYVEYLTSVCSAYRIPYTVIDVTNREANETMKVIDKVLKKIGLIK